eukprot:COSAG06_NODE_1853_length_8212_cov_2.785529_5_plen_93_part_00
MPFFAELERVPAVAGKKNTHHIFCDAMLYQTKQSDDFLSRQAPDKRTGKAALSSFLSAAHKEVTQLRALNKEVVWFVFFLQWWVRRRLKRAS